MDPTSPAKRRALAPLNANAMSPNPKLGFKPTPQLGTGKSPTKSSTGLKRPFQFSSISENVAKKQCNAPLEQTTQVTSTSTIPRGMGTSLDARAEERPIDRDQTPPLEQPQRQRSTSPDASSVFDNSVIDTSHDAAEDTTLTEPDAAPAVAAAPRPRRVMTREEARQNAQILRLRLGLASYKVRTGQTDVPLERLQMRPLPGIPSLRQETSSSTAVCSTQSTATYSASCAEERSQTRKEETANEVAVVGSFDASTDKDSLSQSSSAVDKPLRGGLAGEDNEQLAGSGLRGGAANGLLSLARSSR